MTIYYNILDGTNWWYDLELKDGVNENGEKQLNWQYGKD